MGSSCSLSSSFLLRCLGFQQVIDTKTKGILRSFREHQASTRAVRWSCGGLQLASGSDDKTLRLWDLPTSAALQVGLPRCFSAYSARVG